MPLSRVAYNRDYSASRTKLDGCLIGRGYIQCGGGSDEQTFISQYPVSHIHHVLIGYRYRVINARLVEVRGDAIESNSLDNRVIAMPPNTPLRLLGGVADSKLDLVEEA